MQLTLGRIDELPEPAPEMIHRHAAPPPQARVLPGPIVNGVTYQSYTLTLYVYRAGELKADAHQSSTDTGIADLCLRVRHGGGDFLYHFNSSHLLKSHLAPLLTLPDNALYAVLFEIWNSQDQAWQIGRLQGESAAAEKRRAKRKQRDRSATTHQC